MRGLVNTDSASLTSDRAKTYVGPRLQGRHVHLRAVLPEDLTYLRLVETSSELAPQWRLRGSTPSPQDWAQGSTAGVLAQFLALANRDRAKVGLVTAYNANFRDGHAQLAAVAFDPARPGPLMPIAIGLFIEYVFRCWPLRKLYMDVAEYNLPQFASGVDKLFSAEGHLREHYYLDGQYWDKYILSLSREQWGDHPKRFLAAEQVE